MTDSVDTNTSDISLNPVAINMTDIELAREQLERARNQHREMMQTRPDDADDLVKKKRMNLMVST